MKRLILTLLLVVGMAGRVSAAELLVRAKGHWMDELTQAEVDKMGESERGSYEARSQKGDIIVVRPDDWKWGKEEQLPNYIVVKVPQMTTEEAQKYEEPLYDKTNSTHWKRLRNRKHALSKTDINSLVILGVSTVTLTKIDTIDKVIIKTGDASEVVQPSASIIGYLWREAEPYLNVAFNFWVKDTLAAQFLFKTVKSAGGDYTSLEACLDANEQDLTGDGWFDIEIDGTWESADTTQASVGGYTTTTNDYINIYTTVAARHDGRIDAISGKDNYRIATSSNIAVLISVPYVKFQGIEVRCTGPYTHWIIETTTSSYNTIAYNILHNTQMDGGSADYAALYLDWHGGGGNYIYNNLIYAITRDWGTAAGKGFQENTGVPDNYIYNNTIYGCADIGFLSWNAGRDVLKNNIVYGNESDFSGTFDGASDYNFSKDDTAPEAAGNSIWGDTDGKTPDFVNVSGGSEDFHLQSTSDAIGEGVDLSGDFTDDIDGDTRSAWDIGADEYVAAEDGFPALYPATLQHAFNAGFSNAGE